MTMTLLRWIFAPLLLLSLSREPALAGPQDKEAAIKLYEAGEIFYKQQRYEDALRNYQEAYRLIENPVLLFNIAQCYRLLGRNEEALRSYRSFLSAAPDTPYRAEIEGRIGELEALLAPKPADPPPPGALTPEAPAPPPPLAPKLLLGGAAAGGALGLVMGALTLSRVGLMKDLQEDPQALQGDLDAATLQARRLGLLSDGLFLVAVGSGAAGYVLKLRAKPEPSAQAGR
jgi:tetratricopeptide (TPR) repeat protein